MGAATLSLPEAEVQRLFEADRAIVAALGVSIVSVAPDSVTLKMLVGGAMINSQGFCHGGYLFTLADTAAAYTVATRGVAPLSTAATISYIAGAVQDEELCAIGRVEIDAERTAHISVRIQGKDARNIALYTGTVLKRSTPHSRHGRS